MSGDILICDTETYPNFHSIGFMRPGDGKTRVFEHSVRKPITDRELDLIRAFMTQNTVVGYNFNGYDVPMIAALLAGRNNRQLKLANDRIIVEGMKPWFADKPWNEGGLGITVPRWSTIDLMEPQPNARASLKTLAGRMHAPLMQDLPYDPDHELTEDEMDRVLAYMGNDLQNTALLYAILDDALDMRAKIGTEFDLNFMSKSDAQMGEGMIKKRVEQARGERVFKVDTPAGTTFRYNPPEWLRFESEQLQRLLERIRNSDFTVRFDGKVQAPEWLEEESCFTIGDTEYAMGIGGLHSTEKNRSILATDDHVLYDFDVASYYPAIILNAGLYPKALGPSFIDVYRQIRDDRVVAKRAGDKTRDKGLKIALNGSFGKLGSSFSVLYAPHLMIAITLGGQLALLMLIERAEAAGIKVVSGNTDGVVFLCPAEHGGEVAKSRLDAGLLSNIVAAWEAETGFELEATEYTALYNASVNSYYAFKPDGTVKVKGKGWTGRHEKDIRSQLMKNPAAEVVALAVIEHIRSGTPLEDTIRANTDIRDFVTVVNVAGGGTWRGQYLGKVVRFYYSTDGDLILYKNADARTGNHKKVGKSEGAHPLMNMPEGMPLPADIDYAAYVRAAEDVLMDIGFVERPQVIKPLKVFKHSSALLWAIMV